MAFLKASSLPKGVFCSREPPGPTWKRRFQFIGAAAAEEASGGAAAASYGIGKVDSNELATRSWVQ